MPCFHPKVGYRRKDGGFTENVRESDGGALLTVRCGGCLDCLGRRVSDYSVRVVHEAQFFEESSFSTLTYSDEHLPLGGSLCSRDLQLFFHRLRKAVLPKRVRFFCCGEYGGRLFRPHYHVVVFGHAFEAGDVVRRTGEGFLVRRSPELEKLWPFGMSETGPLVRSSGDYVAKYIIKDLYGGLCEDDFLKWTDPGTGEVLVRERAFVRSSRRPGLGARWRDEFRSDWFDHGFVVVDGAKRPVPEYYVRGLNAVDRDDFEARAFLALQAEEELYPGRRGYEQSPARLEVKEELALLRRRRADERQLAGELS